MSEPTLQDLIELHGRLHRRLSRLEGRVASLEAYNAHDSEPDPEPRDYADPPDVRDEHDPSL